MIRSKILVLSSALVLLLGTASAAFYVVEDGQRKKVAPAEQAQKNAAEQSRVTSTTQTKDSAETSSYVDITGDTLQGALDMAGFGITGLPTPDDPQDAATKRYVDTNVGSGNGTASNGTETPGLPEVLLENNVATEPIRFLQGVMLGDEAEADEGSIAIGENASATNSSVAIGENSRATNGTAKIGSEDQPLDLEVTGDLEVEGRTPGDDTVLDKGTVNATETGVFVLIDSDSYTVSLTSVDSFGDVAVFNKTDTGFEIRSENGTVTTDFLVMENN